MLARALVAIQGFIILAIWFSLLSSVAVAMTSQEDLVQAILALSFRLEACEAVDQMTRPLTMSSLVNTKLIGKPLVFAGTKESWTDWAFVFKVDCSAFRRGSLP
jgi:hypothetical protein